MGQVTLEPIVDITLPVPHNLSQVYAFHVIMLHDWESIITGKSI